MALIQKGLKRKNNEGLTLIMTHELRKLVANLQKDKKKFIDISKNESIGLTYVQDYAKKVIQNFKKSLSKLELQGITIFACGGLGRGEISFDSDLDLIFLYKKRLSNKEKRFIETLISLLWDNGFIVGQQVATEKAILTLAKKDFSICTSLIFQSFLGGNEELYLNFRKKFFATFKSSRKRNLFIRLLKETREQRIKQYGESIYLIEPNIKEGLGGMRDVHSILWGGSVCLDVFTLNEIKSLGWINEEELQWLLNGYDFLWKTRIQLHRLGGNKKDQLTLQDQKVISKLLGFSENEIKAEEAFMQSYYTHTSRIKRITNFFIDKLIDKFISKNSRIKIIPGPFVVTGNLIHFKDPEDIKLKPQLLMELFWNAARLNLKFYHDSGRIIRDHLDLIKHIHRDKNTISMFFEILLNEKMAFDILKAMHETKFLDTFIPEFLHQRYRVQYDTYHTYTVDEHLLRCVKELHNLKQSEYAYLFKEEINEKILFLAALLHDIGKGYGVSHLEKGEELVKTIGMRLLLSDDEIQLLCFLVKNHLLLAETALKRDLSDEKPIEMCVYTIGSLTKLYMLFLLQIADSKATGPRAWNNWRKTLLEELFIKIKNMFTMEGVYKDNISKKIELLKKDVMELGNEYKKELTNWLENLSIRYLLAYKPINIYHHFLLEQKVKKEKVVIDVKNIEENIWEIIFICNDHPKLFDFITGVLWINGINILAADIYTRRYNLAFDILKVENIPDQYNLEKFINRLKNDLINLIDGNITLEQIYEKKYVIRQVKPIIKTEDKVIINEEASDFYTVIEVYTWERPGVLHTISKVLHRYNLNINFAKITTPGEQVADIFYVTTKDGEKILDPNLHQLIKHDLIESLKGIT